MTAPDPNRCPHCFAPLAGMPCPACGWRTGLDNPPPALALGQVLDGRYRIGRVLGHGGFGITYLAWDDNLHLRLAIKEYLPRDSATRAPDGVSLAIYSGQAGEQFVYGLERFLEEARALAHFDQHPGIVTVKNFFRAHGTGYCVMDYVAGITLRHYLDQQPGGRISVADALKLLTPVMDALRAVHKAGLLHRDLAPDNIYLTEDGRIKLLDFGAARFAASEHSKSLSIILKPGYAPEEQYRSKGKQGPWTDVYGLAATFYRAITGTVPPEALDRTEADELLPPSKLGIAIPPQQEAVLLQGLAIKAPLRYQSISAFQQAWRTAALPVSAPLAAAGAAEATPTPVTPAPGAANAGEGGLSWALAGIVALLAVAGAVLWSEQPEPPSPRVTAPPPKPAQTEPTPAVPIMAPPAPVVTLAPAAPDPPPMTIAAPAEPAVPPAPAPATAEEGGEAAIPQPPATPGAKSPLYFAAEVAPTANAPQEAPLCYKFMVAGPEEQLRKLKAKYPGLYDGKILANPDGSKTLQAKRQDEAGKVITYFYATSPSLCNSYQKNRLDAQHPAETPTSPGTAQAPGNAGDDGKSSSDRSDQSDIAPGKITLAQAKTELESLTYRGVEFFQGNNIHLIKGQYKEGRAYAVLTDFVEIGQINGKAVAAAILLESGGGSGEVRVLSVLSRQDGHWTGIASTDLGDRVVIKSLQIKKDLVIVTMIAKRPNDAGCCPTLPVTDAYSLKGNKLIRVSRK